MRFAPAMRYLLFAAAGALLAVTALAGEQEFCVAGTVLNGVTGEVLRRAAVTLPESAVLTDAAGAFRFCQLPAGTYSANAEKPGFAEAGSRVVVGPSRENLVLRLQPLSAITGKVSDGAAEPLQSVLIQLLSIRIAEGRRHVRVAFTAVTDDRGEYRLARIPPGRYYLRAAGWAAAPSDRDPRESFAPAYYGGAPTLASASLVTIEPGHDIQADLDVSLRPAYPIQGEIAGFSPLLPAQVELLGADREPSAAPVALDAATGKFRIDGVTVGSYILRATQGDGAARRRGELPLQVDAALNGIALPLYGGVALRGNVRMAADFDRAESSSPACAIKISAMDAWSPDEPALEASTESSGEFELQNVPPGRYRLRMECAGGYLSALHLGDVDLLADGELSIPPGLAPAPVDAVLSADGGTLQVTASAEGEPGPGWLLLLPASGSELHTRLARLIAKYTFSGIAPGDYQVYAWSGSPEAFEYADPDARQAWAARAASVHIGGGDRQSIAVRVAGDKP
jgi:hypothetical protein